jgi:hypothetical protein
VDRYVSWRYQHRLDRLGRYSIYVITEHAKHQHLFSRETSHILASYRVLSCLLPSLSVQCQCPQACADSQSSEVLCWSDIDNRPRASQFHPHAKRLIQYSRYGLPLRSISAGSNQYSVVQYALHVQCGTAQGPMTQITRDPTCSDASKLFGRGCLQTVLGPTKTPRCPLKAFHDRCQITFYTSYLQITRK